MTEFAVQINSGAVNAILSSRVKARVSDLHHPPFPHKTVILAVIGCCPSNVGQNLLAQHLFDGLLPGPDNDVLLLKVQIADNQSCLI
jgi:hypothetical protein